MKIKFLLAGLCWMLASTVVWATPPESLDVSYNQDKNMLLISGRHPTQDRHEHFIRRIKVMINHSEPIMKYLTYQNSASEFRAEIMINGKPGDTIKIEAFCSQGGSQEYILQIPQEVVGAIEPVDHAAQLKSIKDNDHQTLPIIP